MNYDLPAYDGVEKNKMRFLNVFSSIKDVQVSLVVAYMPEMISYQIANIVFMILNSLAQAKTAEVGALINKGTLYQDPHAALNFAWLLVQSEGYRYIGKTIQGLFLFIMLRGCLAAKTGMYSVLQDKIMSFSPLNSREVSEGFITNLIQVDAMSAEDYLCQLNMCLSLFLSLGVSLYFMVAAIEWRLSLGYVVAMLVIRVFFFMIFVAITHYQNRYLRAKDRRMDLLKNMLEKVDFVKTHRMEDFFCLELYEKREEELMELRCIAVAVAVFQFFKGALNKVPSLIIIVLVVYFIPSRMSFSYYLFFLQLGSTLNSILSGVFDSAKILVTDAVSINRIEKFLLAREREVDSIGYKRVKDQASLVAVEVIAGKFKWRFADDKERGSEKGQMVSNKEKISKKRRNNNGSQENSRLSDQLLSGKYTTNTTSVQDGSERIENRSPYKDVGLNRQEGEFYLSDVNLKIKKGETVVILGKNCSGRSSLLYSLLGEMLPVTEQSTVIVNGSVAFLSEGRWLLGMSVRDNIILGNEYDEERMKQALRWSQLEKDIETLQNGLDTSVGDNGDTISGGQKTRIALARCFYQK